MAGKLIGDIVIPSVLGEAERDAMFALLGAYFENVTRVFTTTGIAPKSTTPPPPMVVIGIWKSGFVDTSSSVS